VAEAINSSAQAAQPGTGEAAFAENWSHGDGFAPLFAARLEDYYKQVEARVVTPEGFRDFLLLAESRRDEVRKMPIFESELLFTTSDAPPAVRAMTSAATVTEVAS
jgi:hypothetical protein